MGEESNIKVLNDVGLYSSLFSPNFNKWKCLPRKRQAASPYQEHSDAVFVAFYQSQKIGKGQKSCFTLGDIFIFYVKSNITVLFFQ